LPEGACDREPDTSEEPKVELVLDDSILYQEVLAVKPLQRSSPNWATFRLRLYQDPGWRSVAIATQMPFEGTSLTNAAEDVAARIWEGLLAEDEEPPIFITHYPFLLNEADTPWTRVELTVTGRYELDVSDWLPSDIEEVQALVGQEVDPYREPIFKIPPVG
jgi:hypothetical protein